MKTLVLVRHASPLPTSNIDKGCGLAMKKQQIARHASPWKPSTASKHTLTITLRLGNENFKKKLAKY
jgi:hypothetical protein